MSTIVDHIKDDVKSGAMSVEEAIDDAYFAGLTREQAPHLLLPGDVKLMMLLCTMGEKAPPVAVASLGPARVGRALISIVTKFADPNDYSEDQEGLEEIAIVAAICLAGMGVRADIIDQVAARRN